VSRYSTGVPQFGPFELERMLGRGGMAEAFIGFRKSDPSHRPIVLKRIRPDLAHEDEYYRRFVLEAQVASRLHHPNLVRFLEFGRVGNCHYIAMDQVKGWSLRRMLEPVFKDKRAPSPEAALYLGAGILDGLAAMHSVTDENGRPRPMLHRDVTPTNIIITHEGRPVLIDFGITKDVLGPQITLPGRVIGTMRYMAPEHRKAEYIDPRADVFSASVIMFELLAAHPPWPPIEGVRELLRVTFDAPEIEPDVRARVPADVWDVVLKGLDCEPANRFHDAKEMSDALKACATFAGAETEGAAAVRKWAAEQKLVADEDLERPAVDRLTEAGDAEEVMWTASGSLSNPGIIVFNEEDDPDDVDARVLTIPPLPPRRDEALDGNTTEDLRRMAVAGKPRWTLPAVAAGIGLLLAIVWLVLR
jgi:serine/threonine protein kinase